MKKIMLALVAMLLATPALAWWYAAPCYYRPAVYTTPTYYYGYAAPTYYYSTPVYYSAPVVYRYWW